MLDRPWIRTESQRPPQCGPRLACPRRDHSSRYEPHKIPSPHAILILPAHASIGTCDWIGNVALETLKAILVFMPLLPLSLHARTISTVHDPARRRSHQGREASPVDIRTMRSWNISFRAAKQVHARSRTFRDRRRGVGRFVLRTLLQLRIRTKTSRDIQSGVFVRICRESDLGRSRRQTIGNMRLLPLVPILMDGTAVAETQTTILTEAGPGSQAQFKLGLASRHFHTFQQFTRCYH